MTTALAHFSLLNPASVEEAVAAARAHPGSRYAAGGTDLLVNLRRGIGGADALIDLTGIDELHRIDDSGAGLVIGSMATIAEVTRNKRIATRYMALAEAARAIAGPGHRALATVGGNLCLDTRCIYYNQSEWWRSANGFCLKHRGEVCHVAPQGQRCHAAYCGDLAPALLVLGAEVEIAGPDERRRIPLSKLYVEDGRAHLALKAGEIVVAVHLPAAAPASTYMKVRQRGAVDFPLAGVAASLAMKGDKVETVRIAVTGTNSRPFLAAGMDKLCERAVDDKLLQDIDRLVQKQVQPMRTTLISSNYRRLAAAAMAKRAVETLAAAQA
jgi:4-hydroxybenzoyl-CoA reductase subunit beta